MGNGGEGRWTGIVVVVGAYPVFGMLKMVYDREQVICIETKLKS